MPQSIDWYRVVSYVLMRRHLNGPWRYSALEALQAYAARFITLDYDARDIFAAHVIDDQDTKRIDVLQNPYCRMALIDAGMKLEDPRDPPQYEYLSVKSKSSALEADGWKYLGLDPMMPRFYHRYSREKRS